LEGQPVMNELCALALLHEDGLIGGFMSQQSPAPVLIQTTPK
jgi:hypothetical protein